MHLHVSHWTLGLALLACVACDPTDPAPPAPATAPDEKLDSAVSAASVGDQGGRSAGNGPDAGSASGNTSSGSADGPSAPALMDAALGDVGAPFATLSEAGIGLLDAGVLPPGMVADAGEGGVRDATGPNAFDTGG